MELIILAKSSSNPEPYSVQVKWDKNKLSIFCNCPAGELGKLCKHKFSILSNNIDILYNKKQINDLIKINEWVQLSSYPKLLLMLNQAEIEKEDLIKRAKDNYSSIKHKIEKLLKEGM